MKKLLAIVCSVCIANLTNAALSLSGTSYSQSFDSIGSGLPAGWSVNTGASDSSLGVAGATYTATPGTSTSWGNISGAFKNVASAGLGSGAAVADQTAAADRALGVRQTGTFGDPGAAFTLELENTAGLNGFSLSIDMQMLSVQGRSTTWSVQYGLGTAPTSFTTLGTYSDPGVFGSATVTYDSTALSGINNQSGEVWFRVVALSAATGADNRDTFAIDDFSLSYVPEPTTWALIAFGTMFGAAQLGRLYRHHLAARWNSAARLG